MSLTLPWWLPLSVYVWALQMVVFHAVGYAFEWCDRTRTLRQFKVRDIDRKSYRQLMGRVLFNQCVVLLPCMVLMQAVGLCFTGEAHLPLWRFLGSLVVMGIGHDVVQYVTHRHLLHRPSLMRTLRHSVHHSTGASKGISACYMSAPDFFLEIVLPYLLPLALIGGGGSDILFHSMIAGLGAVGGVYEHSGYDFAVLLAQGQARRAHAALRQGAGRHDHQPGPRRAPRQGQRLVLRRLRQPGRLRRRLRHALGRRRAASRRPNSSGSRSRLLSPRRPRPSRSQLSRTRVVGGHLIWPPAARTPR